MASGLVLAVAWGPQFLSTEMRECPHGMVVGCSYNE